MHKRIDAVKQSNTIIHHGLQKRQNAWDRSPYLTRIGKERGRLNIGGRVTNRADNKRVKEIEMMPQPELLSDSGGPPNRKRESFHPTEANCG